MTRETHEHRRLAALAGYHILDTGPEPVFDELVSLAATVCGTPMATLAFLDESREWYKAAHGLDIRERPRASSLCARILDSDETLEIPNAGADECFRDHPDVAGLPSVRACLGVPLHTRAGLIIGAVAVLDTRVRSFDREQRAAVESVGRLVMEQLRLRRGDLEVRDRLAREQELIAELRDRDQEPQSINDRLDFHLNNIPLAMVALDAEGCITQWSSRAEEVFGWPSHEVIGRQLDELEIIHPDDLEEVGSDIERLIRGEELRVTRINRNVSRDGRSLVCEWYNSAELDEQGNLVSILSIANDITRRVEAEQALRLSEERYRYAAEASQAALWEYDMRSDEAKFSEGFRDMLGYDRIEDMPKTMSEYMTLMHPDDRKRVRERVESLVASGTDDFASAEFRLLTRSGDYRWFQSNSKVIRDDNGRPVRRLGSTIDIHDRKQAEARRQEIADRLTSTLESITDAFFTLDSNWRFTFLNREAERLLQRKREDLIGSELWNEFSEAVNTRFQHEYQRVLRDECAVEFEEYYAPLDAWFEVRAYPMKEGMAVYFRDITQRKLDERRMQVTNERLRVSEERFRSVARVTTDVIWDLDLVGGHLWWSDGIERVFGHTPEEAGSDVASWEMLVHPDDRVRVSKSLEEAIRGGNEAWSEQYRFLRRDGSYAYVIDSGLIIKDGCGEVARMVGGIKDVTTETEAEHALADSERYYRMLFQSNPHPMWVFDTETLEFLSVNDAAIQHYGYSQQEFLSMTIMDIRPAEDVQVVYDWMSQDSEKMRSQPSMWRHVKANGDVIQVQVASQSLEFEGRPARLVLAQDQTDKLVLEDQLRQAQKLESIGQLTGGIAHDFNNLLTVLLGNAELLVEHLEGSPRLRHLAETSVSAAQRGANLTNRLLAFARRQTLEPKATDIVALVNGMHPLIRRSMSEDIDIRIIHAEGLWPAEIDPTQLETALLNLVINARDALPDGGRISIETFNAVFGREDAAVNAGIEPGEYVCIAVTDTGSGISPEIRDRLFEPFFTTKEKGKGTGLGLPMVYGFIKQSKGHIKIYSEAEMGTTVRMYLPRASDVRSEHDVGKEVDIGPRGHEHVLVVEDDDLVQEYAQRLLEQLGYRVSVASDGASALEHLRVSPDIDLLFTDVIMPGEYKGPELVKAARKIQPDIRVLYTSGYTEDAVVHHGRLEDGLRILQKPYRRLDLARMIRNVLDVEISPDGDADG